MKLSTAVGRALSFSHLAGIGRGPAAKAEDNTDKKPDDAAEDDAPADDDKKPNGKKAKADDETDDQGCDDGDDKPDEAAADDTPDDEDQDPKGKKAKASEDDGDDDPDDKKDQMKSSASYKAGRKAERARCARIFGSKVAGRNPALAAHLAFNTGISSAAALQILTETPVSAAATTLGEGRSARNPDLTADPPVKGAAAIDSRWDKAMQRVRPTKR
ncbi:MAG: hypothetical protein ACXU82_03875 [Caulobacteraceae bacterium]